MAEKKQVKAVKVARRADPKSGPKLDEKYPEYAAHALEVLLAESAVANADALLKACALLGELAERHAAAGVVNAPEAFEWLKSVSVAAVIPKQKRIAVLAELRKSRAMGAAQFLLANAHLRSNEPPKGDDD